MDLIAEKIVKGVRFIAGALLGGVLLMVIVTISGRYFSFNAAWADELARIFFIWSVIFGSISATYKKLHFSVSFFTSSLSPLVRRVLHIFSSFLCIAALVYTGIAVFKIMPVYKIQILPALQISKLHYLVPLISMVVLMTFFLILHLGKDIKGLRR